MSLTGMFDPSLDLEYRLEEAAALLKQAADEEGVDLDQLDPGDVDEMVQSIADAGEEDGEDEEPKTASVTYAAVAHELAKQASAEGIDLGSLDPDTYDELFNKTAEYMTDPSAQVEAEKFAAQADHMDTLGRIAARGFADELNKLAEGDDDDDDDDRLGRKKEAAGTALARVRDQYGNVVRGAHNVTRGAAKGKAKGKGVLDHLDSAVRSVGRGAMSGAHWAAGKAGRKDTQNSIGRRMADEKMQRRVGGGVLAGTAAGGGLAYNKSRKNRR